MDEDDDDVDEDDEVDEDEECDDVADDGEDKYDEAGALVLAEDVE